MITYDPDVIQRFANRLYGKAALAAAVSTVLGVVIGLVADPFIVQALPDALAVRCPARIFALVLGLVGLGQGLERGFLLKLQAQTALCQMQIERNTRGAPSQVESSNS